MNRIFTFTKNISGIDENMIGVSFPLTVKLRRIESVNEVIMDDRIKATLDSVIEANTRIVLSSNSIDNIYFHTYKFVKEIYEQIGFDLEYSNLDYYIVDIQIGKISDDANYGNNIESYFKNSVA